jgi:hypothetical protein
VFTAAIMFPEDMERFAILLKLPAVPRGAGKVLEVEVEVEVMEDTDLDGEPGGPIQEFASRSS